MLRLHEQCALEENIYLLGDVLAKKPLTFCNGKDFQLTQ